MASDWGLFRTGTALVVFVLVWTLALLQLALGLEPKDDEILRFDPVDFHYCLALDDVLARVFNLASALQRFS